MTIRPVRALVLVLLLTVLAAPAAAWAHAFLIETVPEDGTSLATSPAEIRLRFNEPVTPISLELLDDRGRRVAGGPPDLAGDTLRLALPAPLEPGVHTIRYRVTSADGHPGTGTITFGVGVAPPVPGGAGESGPTAVAIAAWLVRWLHLATLLGGFGGGLFVLLAAGPGRRAVAACWPALRALMVLAAATGVLRVGLDGAVLLGGTAADLFGAEAWTVGTAAPAAALAMAAALCGLTGLARGAARRWAGAALAGAAALAVLSLLVTGHAATAPPRWAAAPLLALHGLAAAFWAGSLWPLLAVVRVGPPATAATTVRRFSAVAVVAVALLIAAGAGISLLQGIGPDTAFGEGYGRLWAGKMLLVAALVAVALWNRAVALPRLDPEPPRPPSPRPLRAGILAEIALVAAILLATAAFPMTPPPRSQPGAAAMPEGYSAVAVVGPITALLDITPARAGRNRMLLHLSGGVGTGAGVSTEAEWSMPGVEPILVRFPGGNGGVDVLLPAEGRWTVRIRPDGPGAAAITVTVPIGAP